VNSRVLKWSVERLDGQAAAMPSAIGNLPTRECHSTSSGWTSTIGAHLPAPLWDEYHALLDRLVQDRAAG
jgi:phosphoenolpyruvate carboxykinase (GTP)